jgi:hypothetical protein
MNIVHKHISNRENIYSARMQYLQKTTTTTITDHNRHVAARPGSLGSYSSPGPQAPPGARPRIFVQLREPQPPRPKEDQTHNSHYNDQYYGNYGNNNNNYKRRYQGSR